MKKAAFGLAVTFACFLTTHVGQAQMMGRWQAQLVTPGGLLRFGLEVFESHAVIHNGPEAIRVDQLRLETDSLTISMPHYDSAIHAKLTDDGVLVGEWKKTRGADKVAVVPFRATQDDPPPTAAIQEIHGQWSVKFASEAESALAVFRHDEKRQQTWATFLTTTGDYRYLATRRAGEQGGQIEMSCFDGGHAFLFRATLDADKLENGKFWSGNWWETEWTATRDESASLPDAFQLSKWNEEIELDQLRFPNLDGEEQPLIGPALDGKPIVLEIFGSWCPNCHDAGAYLAELQTTYPELRIVGLAFELTGEPLRDAEQVRRYQQRHGLRFPIFVGGLADKDEASKRFPALDRIRAYPTLIFIDRQRRVRHVYSGFSGPATGDKHRVLKQQFQEIIEGML